MRLSCTVDDNGLIPRRHVVVARKLQQTAMGEGTLHFLEKVMFVRKATAGVSLGLALLACTTLMSTARADIIFTTSGSTSGGSVSASADFKIVGSTLILTLTNTSGSVGDIAQVLDGLAFTLVGGTGVTLTNVLPAGFENCTTGSCTNDGVFHDYQHVPPNPSPTVVGSPYEWTFSNPDLFAGGGSFKPAGIVNGSITGADGLPNNQHNDYLNGPVEFDFSFTSAPTGVTSATFFWGTQPETTGGTQQCCGDIFPAPEPGSLTLIGLALSGLAFARRRLKA